MRNLKREEHDTLTNEDPVLLAGIEFMFFKFYFRFKFDKPFLEQFQFDDFLELPFTFEHEDIELPGNLERSMMECLEKV